MSKKQDPAKLYTRRRFILGALQAGALALLGSRLAFLQVVEGQRYKTLSDKNRINLKILPPSRGQIVDRFGVPLAVNTPNFRVLVIPEQTDSLEQSLRQLQKLIEIDEERLAYVIKQSKRRAKFLPIEIRDNLSWEDVAKIEVNLPDLPGLSIDVGEMRKYPYGASTAHIVGYVGAVSKGELTGNPLLNLPNFKIGKTGIEKSYDEDLRGTADTVEVEVNVRGREIRELKRHPGRIGQTLALTIDAELQQFMQTRLGREQSASAVIMDVHSGAIYAMASHPAFDPNLFTTGLSAAQWEEILASPGHPLNNKAISGQYPPASTFKMISALAGLKAGKITAHSTSYCRGHYDYGGDRFHCWNAAGHGKVNLTAALRESCDVYFYEMATEVGIDNIAAMARQFGLGEKLGIDLNSERPGLVPDKNWKMGYFGEPWRPGETIVASIGQSYFQSTPLQLAVMTSRMVNGGYAVKPWITAYIGEQPGIDMTWPKMDISNAHLNLVRKGMDQTVNLKSGTAHKSRIEDPAMAFGGKTGTAQVKKITRQQRLEGIKNEDLPWKHRHHALFVGYAPRKNPRYACAVVVEHGVGGSVSAAPLARDLLLKTQQRNPAASPVKPSNSTPAPVTKPAKRT